MRTMIDHHETSAVAAIGDNDRLVGAAGQHAFGARPSISGRAVTGAIRSLR